MVDFCSTTAPGLERSPRNEISAEEMPHRQRNDCYRPSYSKPTLVSRDSSSEVRSLASPANHVAQTAIHAQAARTDKNDALISRNRLLKVTSTFAEGLCALNISEMKLDLHNTEIAHRARLYANLGNQTSFPSLSEEVTLQRHEDEVKSHRLNEDVVIAHARQQVVTKDFASTLLDANGGLATLLKDDEDNMLKRLERLLKFQNESMTQLQATVDTLNREVVQLKEDEELKKRLYDKFASKSRLDSLHQDVQELISKLNEEIRQKSRESEHRSQQEIAMLRSQLEKMGQRVDELTHEVLKQAQTENKMKRHPKDQFGLQEREMMEELQSKVAQLEEQTRRVNPIPEQTSQSTSISRVDLESALQNTEQAFQTQVDETFTLLKETAMNQDLNKQSMQADVTSLRTASDDLRQQIDEMKGLFQPSIARIIQLEDHAKRVDDQKLSMQTLVSSLQQRMDGLNTSEFMRQLIHYMAQMYPPHPANLAANLMRTVHQACHNSTQAVRQETATTLANFDALNTQRSAENENFENQSKLLKSDMDHYRAETIEVLQEISNFRAERKQQDQNITHELERIKGNNVARNADMQVRLNKAHQEVAELKEQVAILRLPISTRQGTLPNENKIAGRDLPTASPQKGVNPANDSDSEDDRPLALCRGAKGPTVFSKADDTKRKRSVWSSEEDEEPKRPRARNRDKNVTRMNRSKGGD